MDLAQKIQKYQPSDQTRQLIMGTKIVLLVGISGAGKDTVKYQILRDEQFADIVSYTTRKSRQNQGVWERDGIDYHFITAEQAEAMVDNHEFIETKYVHGTIYGTGAKQLAEIATAHKIAITDVDVQGVDEYKKLSPNVIAIFLLPPTYSEWRRRLSQRYSTPAEFEAEWPKRFNSAIKELTHALEVPYYHFIINDDLENTVRVVREIAMRPDWYNRKDDEARLAARDLLDEIRAKS